MIALAMALAAAPPAVVAEFTGRDMPLLYGRKGTPNVTRNADGTATGTLLYPSLTFMSKLFPLPPADEYWATVTVRFDGTFPLAPVGKMQPAGKLPGLSATGQVKGDNSGNVRRWVDPVTGGLIDVGSHTIRDATGKKLDVIYDAAPAGAVDCGNRGWGGRAVTGCRWSARTGWVRTPTGLIQMRTYFYAVSPVGRGWPSKVELVGKPFAPGQWVTYTQHVRLNTIGKADGVLDYTLCVAGKCEQAYARNDIVWRTLDSPLAQVREAWVDVYCGGTGCPNAKVPWAKASVTFGRFTVTRTRPAQ